MALGLVVSYFVVFHLGGLALGLPPPGQTHVHDKFNSTRSSPDILSFFRLSLVASSSSSSLSSAPIIHHHHQHGAFFILLQTGQVLVWGEVDFGGRLAAEVKAQLDDGGDDDDNDDAGDDAGDDGK